MNTTELKAAESALETALEQVRQLIAADPEPKPEPVRGPLTAAPENGSDYWFVGSYGTVFRETWGDSDLDYDRLARGEVFASKRGSEYKSAFDAIWGQPIGEWEPDNEEVWFAGLNQDIYAPLISPLHSRSVCRRWRKGEVAFGESGKAELERRLAEQKALDERFGL